MNCNKTIIYFGAILFSLLSLGTIDGRADTTVTGTVHNEMVGTFSKKNTSASTIATMKKIAYEDPSITVIEGNDSVTVSENLGTSNDVQLHVQGRKVAVTNGKFSTRVNNSKSVTYAVSDKGTGTTVETAKNSNHINITNKISYGKMIDAMDNMNNTHGSTSKTFLGMLDNFLIPSVEASSRYAGQKSGQKVAKGTHVHCNRFNGKHSNHRYYSRLSGQGWVNYYGSDCYLKHKSYGCPFTKADTKCDGLLKHHPHNCSNKGHWHVTCWYRN